MFSPAFSDDGWPGGRPLALTPDKLTHLPEDSRLRQDAKRAFRVRLNDRDALKTTALFPHMLEDQLVFYPDLVKRVLCFHTIL